MYYRLGADAILVLHFGFIVFVLLGGLLVVWKRYLSLLHLPAVAWGIYVELSGRLCPLTHWENRLRQLAGDAGYQTSFIEQYLLPLIYPSWLSVPVQYVLAAIVVVVNLLIYGWLFRHWRRTIAAASKDTPG